MARQKIEIDKTEFEKMCAKQYTKTGIALEFGCSEDSIERWCKRTYKKTFEDAFAVLRHKGFNGLRAAQYQAALDGNATMLVWLGKQWLDQKDEKQIAVSGLDATAATMAAYFLERGVVDDLDEKPEE